jgi:hypothetical protein
MEYDEHAAKKARERERMRSQGYILKQLWVHPDRVGDYLKAREQLKKPKRGN